MSLFGTQRFTYHLLCLSHLLVTQVIALLSMSFQHCQHDNIPLNRHNAQVHHKHFIISLQTFIDGKGHFLLMIFFIIWFCQIIIISKMFFYRECSGHRGRKPGSPWWCHTNTYKTSHSKHVCLWVAFTPSACISVIKIDIFILLLLIFWPYAVSSF